MKLTPACLDFDCYQMNHFSAHLFISLRCPPNEIQASKFFDLSSQTFVVCNEACHMSRKITTTTTTNASSDFVSSPLSLSFSFFLSIKYFFCVCVWVFSDLNVPAIYYIGLPTFKRFSIKKVSHNRPLTLSLSLHFFAALKNKYCSCSQIVDTDITTYPIDIRTGIKSASIGKIHQNRSCK